MFHFLDSIAFLHPLDEFSTTQNNTEEQEKLLFQWHQYDDSIFTLSHCNSTLILDLLISTFNDDIYHFVIE